MNRPLFKADDHVYCKDSEELTQPLTVECLNPWCKPLEKDGQILYIYYVRGTHRKKGNQLTVTLVENQMKSMIE